MEEKQQKLFENDIEEIEEDIYSWLIAPLNILEDELKSAMRYTMMIVSSIRLYANEPLAKRVDKTAHSRGFDRDSLIILARDEVDRRFQRLFEQTLINQFAYLESGIKGLIVSISLNYPKLFSKKELDKVKVGLGGYLSNSGFALGDYFFRAYEAEFGKGAYGPDRFNKLLEPLDLHVQNKGEMFNKIFEQAQIRNLLLHKNGVIDNDFMTRCGHKMQLTPGNRIQLSIEQVLDYMKADLNFIVSLEMRASQHFNTILDDIGGQK